MNLTPQQSPVALNHTDLLLLSELQPEDWPDIIPHFDFYITSPHCFPIKIMLDGKIAGLGTSVVHNDVAWLAHIIVHSDFRKRGLGQLITETLIDGVKSECETIYLIASDLGAPIYEKVGFVTETEYLYFKELKIGSPFPLSDNNKPYDPIFREQISTIDKAVSTEDRFFEFGSHLLHGFVYTKNDKVKGFYLPTHGDGLIIANTHDAGIALLKLHLNTSEQVILPRENLAGTTFLHELGFKEFKVAKRMRLGRTRPVKLADIYNRIGGNIG